jgi:hypothetical protein
LSSSRFYRHVPNRNGEGDTWVRRGYGKPYTAAWAASRAKRAAGRGAVPEQQRDMQGYIPKVVGGVVVLHDPGVIDRHLYLIAARKRVD